MGITHYGRILVFVARLVGMAQWKDGEIVLALCQSTAAKIALFWALQKKSGVVTYFLVQSTVIFRRGQSSASVAKVVEMVQKQELEIVQTLFHNMVAKIVL